VTQGGGIATWMDETTASHTKALDQPCFVSDPIKNEQVKSLQVCSLFSVVLTQAGSSGACCDCCRFSINLLRVTPGNVFFSVVVQLKKNLGRSNILPAHSSA